MLYKRLSILIVLIVLCIMLFFLNFKIHYQYKKNPIILNSPLYCEEISHQILDIKLKQFYFKGILNTNDYNTINFRFSISEKKYYNSYNYSECLLDIINIRKTITEYLANNPANELNTKYIKFTFDMLQGNEIYMYNYSENEKSVPENQFLYFKHMYIDSTFFSNFTDARVIGIYLNNIDDISLLSNYTNLECVHLRGKSLNIIIICKFKRLFPNCKIYYNGKIIA